jgi:hypothetical protein
MNSRYKQMYHSIKNEKDQYNLLAPFERKDYLTFMINEFDKDQYTSMNANSVFRNWFNQDAKRVYFERKYKNGFFTNWTKKEIMIYKEILYSNEFDLQEMENINLSITKTIGRFFGIHKKYNKG